MMFQEERARSELALAVSKARQSAGLTQAELADKVDTSQSAIARLESGRDRRMPTLPLLARIAAATGRRLVVGFDRIRRAG
ncbi:MAG: helix-turn-helix transcriptional regulator [Deltaproteobacteria bacterium]|nr:helix-turn-helix transcriptional regulator [Deltaproteobacteria bacterium]